jgi:hypothetical protein
VQIAMNDSENEIISKKRNYNDVAMSWIEAPPVDGICMKKVKNRSAAEVSLEPVRAITLASSTPDPLYKKRKPDEPLSEECVKLKKVKATKKVNRKRTTNDDDIPQLLDENATSKKSKLENLATNTSQSGKRKRIDAKELGEEASMKAKESKLTDDADDLGKYSEFNHWKLQLPSLDSVLESIQKK